MNHFFGPANSLILLYDQLTFESARELEAQMEEVRKFYRFVKASELLERIGRGKPRGMAVLVLRHARKSTFLHAIPLLREREIPFLLVTDPQVIGLNRLPPEEELEAYRSRYGESAVQGAPSAWRDPEGCNVFLEGLRQRVGPLPIERLDPTNFFTTWGKILEIPPALREVAFPISSDPANFERLSSGVAFVRRQVGAVRLAFCEQPVPKELLEPVGLMGLLTPREGVVDKGTDPWNLPRWKLSPDERSTGRADIDVVPPVKQPEKR